MNQFDAAKLKFQQRQQMPSRQKKVEEVSVKREEPKPVKKVEPMVITITGLPYEMKLTVDYAGTLTSGQLDEKVLLAMFKKCLLPIGRVR
jgi:hypothetical protein